MLINAIKSFWKDEEAASAVEYGIMVALIAAVIVATVKAIGSKVGAAFTTIDTQLTN